MGLLLAPDLLHVTGGNRTLLEIIQDLSLDTNLQLCYDAGASASYGGSGQTWTDLDGTQDLWFGADGSATTDDPTFNGSAGGLSNAEYMSGDGGDYFRAKAQPAFIENVHKNSAQWSGFVVLKQTGNVGLAIIGDTGSTAASAIGFDWVLNSGKQQVTVATGVAAALFKVTDTVVGANVWNVCGITVDEPTGAGGGFFWKNKAYDQVSSADTWDATYSSPSSSSADYTFEVGAIGNANTIMANGSEIACLALWQGDVRTKADFDNIYDAINGERAYI